MIAILQINKRKVARQNFHLGKTRKADWLNPCISMTNVSNSKVHVFTFPDLLRLRIWSVPNKMGPWLPTCRQVR